MKLVLRTPNLELARELQREIHDTIYRALARVSPQIREVAVTVTDTNGPRGGVDKQCRLVLRGRSIASIVVAEVGADVAATVAAATGRAEQAMLRALARRRSFAA